MKNTNNRLIDAATFLNTLEENPGTLRSSPMTIRGHVTIDSTRFGQNLPHLDSLTFIDGVTIRGFKVKGKSNEGKCMIIGDCNFADGLIIDENHGLSAIVITNTSFGYLTFWNCVSDYVHLQEVKIEKTLDVSGMKLKEDITLQGVTFNDLALMHGSTEKVAQIPLVKTDVEVAAFQFRMLGVPVIVPTSFVRKVLQNGQAVRLAS